ncbi:hypothetical protein [Pseudomonas atacamensis]|uniref:hypothetical protein n=1 Tax=Pseudomonas atacamensis TaxID=2565368 RepID=UPI0028B32A57|nr:hypothetical protein [Pseudomonas atacamensis]MDT6919558.1 hypothetical protein [Pseudomonas atacamensis]
MKNNQKKIKATSLMSEHSIEYCLVPRMLTLLKQHYEYVTPVYPAMMREFSKKSYDFQCDTFRALALFPRRPKVTEVLSQEIYITINQELYSFEEFMRAKGIPTIAGCPVVSTIWELSSDPKIVWIDINHPSLDEYLNNINLEKKSAALLNEEEILRRLSMAQMLSLEQLGDTVREFRRTYGAPHIYGPKYKPIFFLTK